MPFLNFKCGADLTPTFPFVNPLTCVPHVSEENTLYNSLFAG